MLASDSPRRSFSNVFSTLMVLPNFVEPCSQLQVVIRDRAEGGACDVGGVFRQHATRVAGRGLLPRLATGGQFLRRNGQRQFPFLGVNADRVAVLYERNRP